jgi:hypothetical protein
VRPHEAAAVHDVHFVEFGPHLIGIEVILENCVDVAEVKRMADFVDQESIAAFSAQYDLSAIEVGCACTWVVGESFDPVDIEPGRLKTDIFA